MCRYIDADEALKIIKKMLYETALNNFTTDRKFADACEEIAEHRLATWIGLVPTADVVDVKHGKNISDNGFLCNVCSFGDFGGFHGYEPNYCPNCGADMRGGSNDGR